MMRARELNANDDKDDAHKETANTKSAMVGEIEDLNNPIKILKTT